MNSFLYCLSLSWISWSSGKHPTQWCHEEASLGHGKSIPLLSTTLSPSHSPPLHPSPVESANQSHFSLLFVGPPTLITDTCELSVFLLSMKQANPNLIRVLFSYKPWPLYLFICKYFERTLHWLLLKQIPIPIMVRHWELSLSVLAGQTTMLILIIKALPARMHFQL